MTSRQRTLILLGVALVLSSILVERAECIQLCGRRLSDFLNYICEKHGGFHTPLVKRSTSNKSTRKPLVIEILRPLTRRLDSGAESEDMVSSSNDGDVPFSYQRGIVDECCKKQCSLTTLVSYCANVQHAVNVNLGEMLPSENENFPVISEEEFASYQAQKASSPLDSSSGHPYSLSGHVAYSSRPNLGISARNRPIFTAFPQVEEDEDRALGEYRF